MTTQYTVRTPPTTSYGVRTLPSTTSNVYQLQDVNGNNVGDVFLNNILVLGPTYTVPYTNYTVRITP